jgi:hypothetical protein
VVRNMFRNCRKNHNIYDILSSTFWIHNRIHHQDQKSLRKIVREEPLLNSDEAGEKTTFG